MIRALLLYRPLNTTRKASSGIGSSPADVGKRRKILLKNEFPSYGRRDQKEGLLTSKVPFTARNTDKSREGTKESM